MTFHDEISQLRARIVAARAKRDSAQGSGTQDHYIDGVFRLEALERELEALRQEGLRASASREAMAELGIRLDHGAFCVGAARYARLEDAVKFAQLLRMQRRRAA
jgi:hypothetical protein